jgi:putative (di)nucleoside polyphosphate hydrolase
MAVFNPAGLVWIGRRAAAPDEAEGPGHWWQMPQGGLDKGEDPREAALRELYEETSMRSLAYLGETEGWLSYDLPAELIGRSWGGRYRGQTQKWFAFRFEGEESEIEIAHPGGGAHKPEFGAWRWDHLARAPELIVPFKRGVYREVAAAFARFAA